MTANNIPPRWYVVDKIGEATLCADEKDAHLDAEAHDRFWPNNAPHVAVQLAPVQPAIPADEWINQFISLAVAYGDQRHFEVEADDKRDAACRSTQAFANLMKHARRRIEGGS